MDENKIFQCNQIIAQFMGWTPDRIMIYTVARNGNMGKIAFNESWDLLMPVVEKICKTKIGDGVEYVEYPYLRTFGMLNEETKNPMVRFNGFGLFEADKLMEATFLAVIDFLKWYKNQ